MAEMNEFNHCSLAVCYELDKDFDSDKFIKMRLRVCHDGINPNGSHFDIKDINAAAPTIKNIPILANVVFDKDNQPQFGGHDMNIEKDKVKDGEYRMIYEEVPIGVIPETNNYAVEEFEGKNYVFVDGYIWRGYSNYAEDIIERDKNIKLSMEININEFSFNAEKKVYNITDYVYTGITFLGNCFGTGMKNALATTEQFSNTSNTERMLIIMRELKETLAAFNKNTEKGGRERMNTENFETEELSTAQSNEQVFGEEQPKQVSETKFTKTFEISHEDIRYAIYNLLASREAETDDCFYIDEVFDEYFDYSSWDERKTYRQNYTKNDEDISFVGEPFEIFVVKLTADEKAALEKMKNDYPDMENEIGELKEYKANVEKAALESEKTAILGKWSEILKDNEAFSQLRTDMENYSVDELETKCKCIFADTKATFSAKPALAKEQSMVKIPITVCETNRNSRYGDLFDRFASKE